VKRAKECLWLATVSPPEFRENYLKLAAKYERLAKEAETDKLSTDYAVVTLADVHPRTGESTGDQV
jgi:hypothetical protein